MENKFWKVIGNMKNYKRVSPGCRHKRSVTRFHLAKGNCIKRLSFGKRSTGGRSTRTGRITIRRRGGGHKRRIRKVDFYRRIPGQHEVVRLEYDPNRTAELALLRHLSTNEFSYIIRPADLNPGDIVNSWIDGLPQPLPGEDPMPRSQIVKPGNCLKLKDIPVGTFIHSVGLKPDGPGQLLRSAGTSGQVLSTGEEGYAQVRLMSKEVRLISVECVATTGVVGNADHKNIVWGKAGASRRKGRRPYVRGIAMSPVDHPHGGGSKSKGGKHPRSIWGWKTKGVKTVRKKKWYVVTPKWKAV